MVVTFVCVYMKVCTDMNLHVLLVYTLLILHLLKTGLFSLWTPGIQDMSYCTWQVYASIHQPESNVPERETVEALVLYTLVYTSIGINCLVHTCL